MKNLIICTYSILLLNSAIHAQTFKFFDESICKELQTYNRKSEIVTENGISFIRYNEQKEEGIVWLPVENF